MKIKTILIASAAVIATTACKAPTQVATNSAGTVKTETISQTEGAIHKVLYGTWTAIDVNSVAVSGTDRPYIEFGEDPSNPFIVKCYAYDGCNYINGSYAVTPGGAMKRISDFISTMKMCDGANYEMGMNLALNDVTNYKRKPGWSIYCISRLQAAKTSWFSANLSPTISMEHGV